MAKSPGSSGSSSVSKSYNTDVSKNKPNSSYPGKTDFQGNWNSVKQGSGSKPKSSATRGLTGEPVDLRYNVARNPYDVSYTPVKKGVAPATKKPVAPAPVKKATKKVTQITIPGTPPKPKSTGPMTSKDAMRMAPGEYKGAQVKFSNGKTYSGVTVTGGRGGSGGSVGNYTSGGGSTKSDRSSGRVTSAGDSSSSNSRTPATRNK